MATQKVAPVTCSNCNAQFTAPVETTIDGQDPAQKSALLQGSLNAAQCPQCGFTSMLNTPILYYDLEKELAFVLSPGGLQTATAEQEKIIGDLTNTLVNSLPAEQRKFYLLNPKQFLSLDSMIKAILEADGITEEELEAQAAKIKLIEEFLQSPDEATLKQKAKEHDDELDRQFFEILTASIQEAQMVGNSAGVQALIALRSVLVRWSSKGRKAVAEIDAELGLVLIKSQEELLNKLQAAENEEEFESLIEAGHPLLDYGFFQKLTGQIDEATKANDTKKIETLKVLRARILEAKDRQEEKLRAAMERSAELLRDILRSGNPEQAIADRLDKIDESFFMILSANINEAQRQNQNEAAQAMGTIGNIAMQMLRDRQAKQKQAEEPSETEKSEIHIATR